MSENSYPLLEAKNLKIELDERRILTVNFRFEAGFAVRLKGQSGSGKTTLVRTLARLTLASAGEIYFRNEERMRIPPPQWRRKINYLAQNPRMLPGTVEDNLKIPFQFRFSANSGFNRGQAIELLERVGMAEDFLPIDAGSISGGEASRVALVRSILCQPDIILADEITAPLDDENAESAVALLKDWLGKGERGLLTVSHQTSAWDKITTQAIKIEDFLSGR